ncbi:MAG: hypothetical protein HYR86_01380 [Candidatus Rokubacteria bacterium]|nr:hypothetical protein [Candidatus Rokubacteria bacterium]
MDAIGRPEEAHEIGVIVDVGFARASTPVDTHLTFTDCAAAVAACERLVDGFLDAHVVAGLSPDAATALYRVFGDRPVLVDPSGRCDFRLWEHVARRAAERTRPPFDLAAADEAVRRLIGSVDEPLLALVFDDDPETGEDLSAEIYLINATAGTFVAQTAQEITASSADEEGGSSTRVETADWTLPPGTATRVGDIVAWELDFALYVDVAFRRPGDDGARSKSYHLNAAGFACVLPLLEVPGSIFRGRELVADG